MAKLKQVGIASIIFILVGLISGASIIVMTAIASTLAERNLEKLTFDSSNRIIATLGTNISAAVGDTIALYASTDAGTSMHTLVSAATTNATIVKNTPGTVVFINAFNQHASNVAWIKFKDTATPNCATASDVKLNIGVPPNKGGTNNSIPIPAFFLNGISYCITGDEALNDETAVGAGDVVVNVVYQR